MSKKIHREDLEIVSPEEIIVGDTIVVGLGLQQAFTVTKIRGMEISTTFNVGRDHKAFIVEVEEGGHVEINFDKVARFIDA